MKHITNIRRAVCNIANQIRKTGVSLSIAFRRAWKMVKQGITTNAVGVSYGVRQQSLAYAAQFATEDLAIKLERETDNKYDPNAIKVALRIRSKHIMAYIGYLPKVIAAELAPAMDAGVITLASTQGIVGGYDGKYYGIRLGVAF